MEDRIRDSFQLAKTDILKLGDSFNNLNLYFNRLQIDNKQLLEQMGAIQKKLALLELRVQTQSLPQARETTKIVRVRTPKSPKRFSASNDGAKFHELNCVFAKNIQPKKKLIFKSKSAALNAGYKACNCVKRV